MTKYQHWTHTNRNNDEQRTMGLAGVFDSVIMTAFQLTDELYDKICETATVAELDTLIDVITSDDTVTFSTRRRAITIINHYKQRYPELVTTTKLQQQRKW